MAAARATVQLQGARERPGRNGAGQLPCHVVSARLSEDALFVDSATIEVRAGAGGSGAEAFRREKGVPRGGPSGGDGGAGGDVVLVGAAGLSTLSDFRHRRRRKAERGRHGEGSNRTGRSGRTLELRAPPGTEVFDDETAVKLGELLEPGQRLVVARGGRGGRGNARFASAARQAPRRWEPGQEGERRRLRLELKLLADVGLVGEPNAGKSTLLSRVSAAKPKIAGYPFTTLSPVLGVVDLPGFRSFVLADIPGIVEGAHKGRGLGHRFLRHIERTRALLLLAPADAPDPRATLAGLRAELEEYSAGLAGLPFATVLSKADLAAGDARPAAPEAPGAWGSYRVSAATGEGIAELLEGCWRHVCAARDRDEEDEW